MEEKMSGLSREMIIHPGETLKEILEDRNMSQFELALRTSVTPKHISTIISGEKNISVSFAKKLEYALNVEAEFWINLQALYDKELLEFDELNSITDSELAVLKKLKAVVSYLVKSAMIPSCNLPEQMVLELRKILNVSNLTSIPNIVSSGAFRAQTSVSVDEYILFAWQRICELIAEKIEVNEMSFSEQKENILKLIPQIKSLMFKPQKEFVSDLQTLFAQNGIAFCIAPFFQGAPVQGFIRNLNSEKTILCMTFRQKKADIFWFSLFHELGHFVNGDAKQKFIDFESVESERETKADIFAQNKLIDKRSYISFVKSQDFSLSAIKSFAKEQNLLPCIVIGRLKKEKYLKWSDYSEENITYSTDI